MKVFCEAVQRGRMKVMKAKIDKKAELLKTAENAAYQAYAPYSNFRVGAALLCSDGTIFSGANVENRSFGLTNCAERSALFTAISQGKRSFVSMLIFCPDAEKPIPPCGACRQVITEFMDGPCEIVYTHNGKDFYETSVDELLPQDSPEDLKTLKNT